MENVADALKMAGMLLLFVLALTVAITMISRARISTDNLMEAIDKTSSYQYVDNQNQALISNGKRIVGLETIIPTLYKYYKEDYAVVFRDKNGEPLTLYTSTVETRYWNQDYLAEVKQNGNKDIYGNVINANNKLEVCSFDLETEGKRNEPWTGAGNGYNVVEDNLDKLLTAGKFVLPSNSQKNIDYNTVAKYSFLKDFKDKRFIESVGRIELKQGIGEIASSLDSKKIIYYTLVN